MKKHFILLSLLFTNLLYAQTTVVDVILSSDDHTTLATAVSEAGLVEALTAEGPFTVFAPTNAAFEALPEGVLDELLANVEDLGYVLKHHVYGGSALAADLSDGDMVSTLAGTDLTVEITNGMVYIDGAMVTIADLTADNGVVHVIDAVLVPELDSTSTTVVDVILGSDAHTTLATAVVEAGLVDALSGEGPFTVFAPTNAAFEALPEGVLDELLANVEDLGYVLKHHVYGGSALAADLSDGDMVSTLAGTDLTVEITNGMVYIDGAMVTIADLTADNGVVHVIDAVLVPEGLSVVEILPLEDDVYLYSVDLMGRVISNFLKQEIVFDIYKSGRIVKRYSVVE